MPLMLNSVHIAGNLTRDPEVKSFGDDRHVANFGIAINRKYRGGDGEMKEETTFVDVECWGRQAELVGEYLTKGRNCLIEGSLKLDQWEAEDGTKRSRMKVSAQRVHFIGGKDDSVSSKPVEDTQGTYALPPTPSNSASSMGDDDEPPF